MVASLLCVAIVITVCADLPRNLNNIFISNCQCQGIATISCGDVDMCSNRTVDLTMINNGPNMPQCTSSPYSYMISILMLVIIADL